MSDIAPASNPGVCDTHDRGVAPDRLLQLQAEAHAFNQVLQITENGRHGHGAAHKGAVEEANKEFYSFLPDQSHPHNLDGGSYEASQAFYEQVVQMPIGERKKLIELAQKENNELAEKDHKLPKMVANMDSSGFINYIDFQQGFYSDHFAYISGMCAEVPDFSDNNPSYIHGGWSIDLPTLNLRR